MRRVIAIVAALCWSAPALAGKVKLVSVEVTLPCDAKPKVRDTEGALSAGVKCGKVQFGAVESTATADQLTLEFVPKRIPAGQRNVQEMAIGPNRALLTAAADKKSLWLIVAVDRADASTLAFTMVAPVAEAEPAAALFAKMLETNAAVLGAAGPAGPPPDDQYGVAGGGGGKGADEDCEIWSPTNMEETGFVPNVLTESLTLPEEQEAAAMVFYISCTNRPDPLPERMSIEVSPKGLTRFGKKLDRETATEEMSWGVNAFFGWDADAPANLHLAKKKKGRIAVFRGSGYGETNVVFIEKKGKAWYFVEIKKIDLGAP